MAERLEDRNVFVSPEALGFHMEKMLGKGGYVETSDAKSPTIYKVPNNFRHWDQEAYDPKLVPIGPLHDRTKAPLNQMEHLKWRYLQDLINRSPEVNSVKKYVSVLWEAEARARGQYSVKIDLQADTFVEMLVLDGCFILEFLIKRSMGPVGSPWKDAKWYLSMLRYDLLLFENQIPFFVLETLFDNTHIPLPNGISLTLLDLALHYVSKDKVTTLPVTEIYHLLHLKYLCDVNFLDRCCITNGNTKGKWYRFKKIISKPLVIAFYFLVSLMLMCKFPRHNRSRNNSSNKAPRAVPSAKNLVEAGVKFKKKSVEDGKECYLNVSFAKDDGTLAIPFLPLQQNTISIFRNLIAFEQCCPGCKMYFTAYATFMDKIIDTPADVAILVRNKVIESKLGTDEDVARLFNNICKGANLNYDKHYLVELFEEVNMYCDSDRHRWRASLVHRYFYNPWAAASFIGAFILLVFTIVATIATIVQTLYTVRSYRKQFV